MKPTSNENHEDSLIQSAYDMGDKLNNGKS